MLLIHLFVCFARVCFCPFSFALGVEGWLRFVIVAYLSINDFQSTLHLTFLKQVRDSLLKTKTETHI